MGQNTVYLCEKPDQGRIIAKALGGGKKAPGGITGDGWSVTWGFGHLLTPYKPHDYNEEYKRFEWDPLPIVPEKFRFKPNSPSAKKQLSFIRNFFKNADEIIIATDADREGELIAYEILNDLKWKGKTRRLWLSDLTVPAVQKSLNNLRDAQETKPLYWAALARTYADWIVGFNLSRAATLKLSARGGKPMSIGRVQTPVLAMIVDLERKIENFKSEDYYEIKALVSSGSGQIVMRYAPPPEKRILDIKAAQQLRDKAQGAKGPLGVKTEAKKQAPPSLPDLMKLQQECNSRFGWSANKTQSLIQKLYETHQALTYPRTDSTALPVEHKVNIPTISGNLTGMAEFSHLKDILRQPIERTSVYNDAKVTAHHAITPTCKSVKLDEFTDDEARMYTLVSRFWLAAHMPDMEYLQTTVTLDAGGVPLRASGRQITKEGWKIAFKSSAGKEVDENPDENEDQEDSPTLPPLKNGETGTVDKAELETKKTKPPSRFTEKSLLNAMANIASYVDDPQAKKTLKATSGIGTPATRASVIETLKKREYITIKKRQLVPAKPGFVLIDTVRDTASTYANPAMTARWEDVLDTIAQGQDSGLTKRFVDGIAKAVRKDVLAIKDSSAQKMESESKSKSGGKTYTAGRIEGDWKAAIANGTPLKVPFDQREKAKELGARWNADKKSWVIPVGKDESPFRAAGFL
jgi:DNA topoisomerase-3